MGRDIHMSAYDNSNKRIKDFVGVYYRNYEWFGNISGEGYNWKYDSFPSHSCYNFLNEYPQELLAEKESYDGYGLSYFTVGEFKHWYEKYRPYNRAGWFSTYDCWKLENGWQINYDDEIPTFKPEEGDDWTFREYTLEDPSTDIYNEILKLNLADDIKIYYFFDC